MLARHRRKSIIRRLLSSVRRRGAGEDLYGLQWGDPETRPGLRAVRDTFLLPYVNAEHTALEIGPGGGRWTRYMLDFKKLFVVDYYDELLAELRKNFVRPNMVFIKNNGTDFPGVPDKSVDYLFSFGVFVHLDLDLIEGYLSNIRSILKPGGNAVIQYADKTKEQARKNPAFSDNTPDKMRAMVTAAGYEILEEDTSLWHSAVVRFTIH
jgi:cyclopropane fatty-acyl-phospholipid synthase-like methyltransferase